MLVQRHGDYFLCWCVHVHMTDSGGEVAIFDATNTTNDRRAEVIRRCHEYLPDTQVIFLESICNDAQVCTLATSNQIH